MENGKHVPAQIVRVDNGTAAISTGRFIPITCTFHSHARAHKPFPTMHTDCLLL